VRRSREFRIGQMVPGGGTWLGGILIPVRPEFMIMHDRKDNKRWLLTHAVLNGKDYYAITDDFNTRRTPFIVYEAWDGPNLPNHGSLRLLIRDGRIGYEQLPCIVNQTQRILSRKLQQRHTLEIIVPATWRRFGDVLGWQRIDY
jgi:hypothetical protein